ncbi:TIGR01777 family oxidoreductase [Motilibacter aurantiacus]|uniref:TIGR01777 family oxidoreductase n=1 Tax=Motilibacter aurantiacus TaxID=2714955 RepID=UPI00140B12D4|nr:TIGR01777 family protein [Motilibacter aurantiacus]
MDSNRGTVAVTGASGLIGRALVADLESDGYRVLRLVRREPQRPEEVRWDPKGGTVDTAELQGVRGIVHLAGAGVGDRRWTAAYKREILDSRVLGTRTIARAAAQLDPRPEVLVSGSAVGFYGETGDRAVDETARRGGGFLADVVEQWEAAASPARDAGIRVPYARTGIVASRKGGAFGRLLPLLRLGLGGRLGSGDQWWSLISLTDEVRALRLLLEDARVEGPVNLTAVPARVRDVISALGQEFSRPTFFAVPAPALRLALGELSSEVLGSNRVEPRRLRELGFSFRHPGLDEVAAYLHG